MLQRFTIAMCTGEWWLECCRFYTAADVNQLAAERGHRIALPSGFDQRLELLRGINREHAPVQDVIGDSEEKARLQINMTLMCPPEAAVILALGSRQARGS